MKILRSIAAIVVGIIISMIVIFAAESVNGIIYAPPGDKPLMERIHALQEDPQAMKAWIESLPIASMIGLLFGWQASAFLGGVVSAWIAGRGRLIHAGFIGAVVLALTMVTLIQMKYECNVTQPDWMLIALLLMPLPSSLLAGWLVSLLIPPSSSTPASQT